MTTNPKQESKCPPRLERFRRALLVSCSQSKRSAPGLLPAIERYDGPVFRVLRRYLREVVDRSLLVCIVSAEFGLIRSDARIPDYDRRMTPTRARELRSEVTRKLASILRNCACEELFISASAAYEHALACRQPHELVSVRFAVRGQGRRLRSLHRWLRGDRNE
jgi:hypothetical protein